MLEVVNARGFETVTLDGRTVSEQAQLIAEASIIVGLHGAALTNLVFGAPGTIVVEMLPANLAWGCHYSRLSRSHGF